MFARLSILEDADEERLRALVTAEPSVRGFPPEGTRRVLGLYDEDTHVLLFFGFFDTRESIQAAERVFDGIGDGLSHGEPGRRSGVTAYEVILDDYNDAARAALVTSLDATQQDMDHVLAYVREQLLPHARQNASCEGALVLADHEHHDIRFITFWAGAGEGLSYQQVAFGRRF